MFADGANLAQRRMPGRLERFIGDRLTRSRLRFVAFSTIVVGCLMLLVSFATTTNNRTINGLGLGSDYFAFYNAATILNDHGLDRLYDLDLQSQIYHQNLPGEAADTSLPFAYAPFVAVVLQPLARLPYVWSYAMWISLSLMLFVASFALVWRTSGLPAKYWAIGLLCALSFEPFVIENLHGGQISAFGLVWLTLAIYYSHQKRQWAAGLALALCAYKPTLLPLILPMLLIMRQWRTLAGFVVGIALLATISVFAVGTQSCTEYARLLASYVTHTSSGGHNGFATWKFIDLNSAMKMLGAHPTHAKLALAAIALVVFAQVWRSRPRTEHETRRLLPMAWASAITWTLVLNMYVGVYDAVLVIPSIVLTCGTLIRRADDTPRALPLRFRIVLAGVWITPWISGFVAKQGGLQVFTIALVVLGVYQLRWIRRRFDQPAVRQLQRLDDPLSVSRATSPC